MLKLRKVDLVGFKSFCERTEVLFNGLGVTAIVGPNGCGKSNLADAINWVLGEQSAKTLRGERMLDVIFNGTSTRPPTGMAEVTLTLIDSDYGTAAQSEIFANLPEQARDSADRVTSGPVSSDADQARREAAPDGTESAKSENAPRTKARAGRKPTNKPGEIVIGRRLFRTGDSEYLLNGLPCRLRDIQDIFMGMGLGPDSYAIIEQGRIGQILSSKPYDRRAIIEEAAGITRYKTKRRLAEAKLESAKQNLARIADILEEVTKQLNSLKRQAAKARRYEEVRAELMNLARVLLRSRHLLLEEAARSLETRLAELRETVEAKKSELQTLESEQAHGNARNFELEAELRTLRNLMAESALELDRAQNRIVYNREQLAATEARIHETAGQLDELERQARSTAEDYARRRQALQSLAEELAARCKALEEQTRLVAELSQLISQASAEREQLSRRTLDLLAEIAECKNQISQSEEFAAAEERNKKRVSDERAKASVSYEQACGALADARKQLHLERAQAELNAQEIRELDSQLRATREAESCDRKELEEVRQGLAAVEARQQALDELVAQRAYTADTVQKLFATPGSSALGFQAVGVLADFAEVNQEYEIAVEEFLRDELEYVVVETFDAARAGVDLLREQVGGRATFFVDSLGKRPEELKQVEARSSVFRGPEVHDGIVCPLQKLVRFNGQVGEEVKRVLRKLQAAYLVRSASSAERLAREYPDCYFVTPDGTFYHGRFVSGGRHSNGGPLSMKRELRELSQEVGGLRERQGTAEKTLTERTAKIRELTAALEEKTVARQEREKTLVALGHQVQQAESDLTESQQQVRMLDLELARIEEELARARETCGGLQASLQSLEQQRELVESEVARLLETERQRRAQLETASQEMTELKATVAQLGERHVSLVAECRRLETQIQEMELRRGQLLALEEQLRAQHAQIVTSTEETTARLAALEMQKGELERTSQEREAEWEALRQRAVECEESLRCLRDKIGVQQEELTQAQIEEARTQADLAHLAEAAENDLAMSLEQLAALELAPLTGAELAAAEENYRTLKARLEAMGPINMMALEEYNQCAERHSFLTTQREDLLASIADTTQTIQEIDTVSQEKFQHAFETINGHFAETFRALFGGGSAEMRLTDVENSLDSGVDLVCQPPGKRLQNVLLLSGGEKALAALALLIAIFRYQPSPFCVLDEVDAPLDETNIGRFTRMIREMSEQTQFIIITHSKKTMEIAPVLYGVTMQEPGVSSIVSVRFEEPQTSPVAAD